VHPNPNAGNRRIQGCGPPRGPSVAGGGGAVLRRRDRSLGCERPQREDDTADRERRPEECPRAGVKEESAGGRPDPEPKPLCDLQRREVRAALAGVADVTRQRGYQRRVEDLPHGPEHQESADEADAEEPPRSIEPGGGDREEARRPEPRREDQPAGAPPAVDPGDQWELERDDHQEVEHPQHADLFAGQPERLRRKHGDRRAPLGVRDGEADAERRQPEHPRAGDRTSPPPERVSEPGAGLGPARARLPRERQRQPDRHEAGAEAVDDEDRDVGDPVEHAAGDEPQTEAGVAGHLQQCERAVPVGPGDEVGDHRPGVGAYSPSVSPAAVATTANPGAVRTSA